MGGDINRIISTVEGEDRPAFLKGILVGVAIQGAVDSLSEPDLSDEEKRISSKIEKLRFGK
jgi:hypothetical protein